MNQLGYRTVNVREWEDAKSLFSVDKTGWAWRGHADESWPLASNLERGVLPHKRQNAESALIERFARRAHHYLDTVPALDQTLQWLSTMQHYGAPTRLLDWTYSPYVAAFFALERAVAGAAAAVWAIDLRWCRAEARNAIAFAGLDSKVPGNNIWNAGLYKKVFGKTIDFVAPVEPFVMNERLTIQQGLFLCQGNLSQSFEANLTSYDMNGWPHKPIIKFILPMSLRIKALTDLDLMDINRATLFPGIDGFAQSLNLVLVQLEDPDSASDVRKLPGKLDAYSNR